MWLSFFRSASKSSRIFSAWRWRSATIASRSALAFANPSDMASSRLRAGLFFVSSSGRPAGRCVSIVPDVDLKSCCLCCCCRRRRRDSASSALCSGSSVSCTDFSVSAFLLVCFFCFCCLLYFCLRRSAAALDNRSRSDSMSSTSLCIRFTASWSIHCCSPLGSTRQKPSGLDGHK